MGRDLHEFLESKEHYSRWITRLIEKYGFVAGQDFSTNLSKNTGRGRPQQDHILTLDMAKELSMVQNNDRGRQARQYFIECERRMKQLQPELTPELFQMTPVVSDKIVRKSFP
ncbi:antA/AntB antirepressor family protein [Corynebacterium pseudodiphtheriticum]|uniref:antA/AntB antirepressor family protein n=1 Tax=Corynebacterium pseudodiphtheriticum TaxID=37637 RepID=UPI0020BF0681|nr:antA/AntB antirepressor family protein [Corynebacterium pseudodiphtheriticum]UQV57320.1 antA/AntB antirepressor family protein [Corynebacterium pseudodiphtheriticum]